MNSSELDRLAANDTAKGVSLYCMATLLADEASLAGHGAFAHSMEQALQALLAGLPRDEQRNALQLSYELSLAGSMNDAEPAPPKLRLVYSRD